MLAITNFITNAHRIEGEVDASVTTVQPGQLFQFNDAGKLVYADGTRKAYPTLNSRYNGNGYGLQGELNEGRDDVSRTKRLALLKGNFEIGTDQYDKLATYTYGQPLTAAAGGVVTPFDPAAVGNATKFHLVIGYVTYVPASDDEMLRYEG